MALMKTCEPAGILPMHRKREFPSRSRLDSVKLRLEFSAAYILKSGFSVFLGSSPLCTVSLSIHARCKKLSRNSG
jgi:hypothetical protein